MAKKFTFSTIITLFLIFSSLNVFADYSTTADFYDDDWWAAGQMKYREWDIEKGEFRLTKEGEELFKKSLEEKRKNPSKPISKYDTAYPLPKPEKLYFSANLRGKNVGPLLKEVAGNGNTVNGIITRYEDDAEWFLTIEGDGGNFVIGTFIQSTSFNRVELRYMTDKNLSFYTSRAIYYNNKKINDEEREELMERLKDCIHISGEASNNEVTSLRIGSDFYSILYNRPNKDDQQHYDIVECDIKYYQPPSKTKYMVYGLPVIFNLSTNGRIVLDRMQRDQEYLKENAYDTGTFKNYKTPLKWTEVTLDGKYEWDAYVNSSYTVGLPPLMSAKIPAMRGIGDTRELSIRSYMKTLDGKDWEAIPLVRITGDCGEAWFALSDLTLGADRLSPHQGEGAANALLLKMYRLKDFKDLVMYEDKSDPQYLELVFYFADQGVDKIGDISLGADDFKVERIMLRYMTAEGVNEELSIPIEKFTVEGDPLAFRSWWPSTGADDSFGDYLDDLGIEWR